MCLTGTVDKRTMEKCKRDIADGEGGTTGDSQMNFSWLMDDIGEQQRGKTVELGRGYFETENKHFSILDAPGHASFVPNMINGAVQADLAVLVVSARKGEFETGFEKGGQTREHVVLVKTAGVKYLVVLVNKMDDPTVNWSQERFMECTEKLQPFLKELRFRELKNMIFIPCSGVTGNGLKDEVDINQCNWYHGPTFLKFINDLPSTPKSIDGTFILHVSGKFREKGTIIMGKVESGKATKGQTLILMPNKNIVTLEQLWVDNNEEVDSIEAGENVKLKLKGIADDDISKGFVLCELNKPCKVGRIFDAHVVILEHKNIICPGYTAMLHLHSITEEIMVQALICLVDKKTGEKSKTKPKFIRQGQVGIMRLECNNGAICMEPFKLFPQLGRFTLRSDGRTIAIGKVLKVFE